MLAKNAIVLVDEIRRQNVAGKPIYDATFAYYGKTAEDLEKDIAALFAQMERDCGA